MPFAMRLVVTLHEGWLPIAEPHRPEMIRWHYLRFKSYEGATWFDRPRWFESLCREGGLSSYGAFDLHDRLLRIFLGPPCPVCLALSPAGDIN